MFVQNRIYKCASLPTPARAGREVPIRGNFILFRGSKSTYNPWVWGHPLSPPRWARGPQTPRAVGAAGPAPRGAPPPLLPRLSLSPPRGPTAFPAPSRGPDVMRFIHALGYPCLHVKYSVYYMCLNSHEWDYATGLTPLLLFLPPSGI